MARTPYDYLQADEAGAGKLLAHAALLLRLAEIYRALVPAHLAQASRLANLKAGSVVIHAESGAVAGKLRQMLPSLLDSFAQSGVPCSKIEVKVRTSASLAQPERQPEQKPLSAQTRGELARLRETLPPCALGAAIERLLARAATRE
ncbi:MAG: DciA family protein [Candidatus Accumulibacter sp.]|uniref:DciA family protein n=1 Tax=Accumulibacter sp. TaxID=2053492 RepID=UPI002879CCE4|nr:DciA family protein [Accumulibacter sp.]MDS4013234.1 DciA family protein [Accumulibacter sp.]